MAKDENTRLLLTRRAAAVAVDAFRAHPRPFVLATAGSAGYGICVVVWSLTLGLVVNDVIVPRFEQGRVSSGVALAALGALLAAGVVQGAATIVRRWAASTLKARYDATLREQVVRRYQALPLAYHRTSATGEQLARASSDSEAAAQLPARLPHLLGMLLLLVLTGVWSFLTDPLLATAGAGIVPAVVVANAVYQRKVAIPGARVQACFGQVSAVAHESFDGAYVVKAYGRAAEECDRFAAQARKLRDAKQNLLRKDASLDIALEIIPSLAMLCLVAIGAWRVDRGAISVGALVGFVNLFSLLVVPIRVVGYSLGDLPRVLAGYDRVREVLNTPAPSGTTADPLGPAVVDGGPGPSASVKGSAPPGGLHVRGVSFGHGAQRQVLQDVSFTAPRGATVAIAGATGSGKSTLIMLLAGLARPERGSIEFDGVELGAAPEAHRPALCAVAFQEAFLFAGTVEYNILLGHDGSQLTEAIRLAGLEQFVAALPRGVQTVVGERGVTLSGGERQRISLARALVRRPRLLLLDEATSAVDASTDDAIMANLTDALPGTTTVTVASRAATLARADAVLHLEEGRVIGYGPHADLLRNTAYARLVQAYEDETAGVS